MSPAIEEVWFRGWILPALTVRGLSPGAAITLSALAFAAIHFIPPEPDHIWFGVCCGISYVQRCVSPLHCVPILLPLPLPTSALPTRLLSLSNPDSDDIHLPCNYHVFTCVDRPLSALPADPCSQPPCPAAAH